MGNLYSNNKQKIISVVSTKSGMGKTTLVESLIKEFKKKGYKVGALKHDAHKFDIDKEGKDSYRFTKAGAKDVVIASSEKIGVVKILEEDKSLSKVLELFDDVDIIFTEGFKQNPYPKIEVHRNEVDKNFLFNNSINKDTFIAIATNEHIEGITNLDINNIDQIVNFIESYIKTEELKTPLINYDYDKTIKIDVVKIDNQNAKEEKETIISEYPLSLILNGKYLNTFLCTPDKLEELIVGFLATKGYISNKNDIESIIIDEKLKVAQVISNRANTNLNLEKIFLNDLDFIECNPVKNSFEIDINTIYNSMHMNLTSSQLFKDTGGVHSVALFDGADPVVICEDVARHNAMDKVIGYSVLNDVNFEDKFIVVSGRISLEMMQKACKMQIPIVVSKSAPTNLSVELAKKLNITLVGFVRGRRMNIYANGYRVKY
ncbi:MAG: formate dehydrogenase accessory sulfurtransferase FdhD [Paraclostridium bifermentans]|uniref:formate dehydrogenase accessory sulfurtransferase FdhD n=1 Tax=Paraclostridium bifermentans TaxID=1490 RepID=UPI0011DE357A|nr:formate dehydrogenase accessory sulfurtransferase FdhD [Paraclostridium bifermentans]MBS6507561.1 formate dehydrogenase accessory sulfurtransferase FdhD [Paraclostridium bifermentans]